MEKREVKETHRLKMISKRQARSYVKGQESSVGVGSLKKMETVWNSCFNNGETVNKRKFSAAVKIQARIAILTAPLNQGLYLRFLLILRGTLHRASTQ